MTNWKLENEITKILYQNSNDNSEGYLIVNDVQRLVDKYYEFIDQLLTKFQNEDDDCIDRGVSLPIIDDFLNRNIK